MQHAMLIEAHRAISRSGSISTPLMISIQTGGKHLSQDLTRYFVWAAVVMAGGVLAIVDWRWIKRPLCGALLIVGMVGGIIVTNVSPFTFGTGSYYMEGVLISAGSALALTGYVLAAIGRFVCRRTRDHRPS